MSKKILLMLMCVLFAAGMAHAKIVFVDADLTNTTINGAAPEAGVNYATANVNDDLWWYRPKTPMNGEYVWESDAGYQEDTEPLITTFTIPTPGTYDIYGLFFINGSGTGNFDCAFSIGSDGPYTVYNRDNATVASASDFWGTVIVDAGGGIWMYKAVIGQVTTTGADESVSVYAQSLPGLGDDERTWYDGVGYYQSEAPSNFRIQFVDVSLNNAKIGGETPTTETGQIGTYHEGSGSGIDGLWDLRTDGYANGLTMWQSDNADINTTPSTTFDAENTNELSATMTIPIVGTYDIYGLIWNNENGDGQFDAAFGFVPETPETPHTIYDLNSAALTPASTSDFVGTVSVTNPSQTAMDMYKVNLGQVTTTSNDEQITIYAQGLDSGQMHDQRTMIDGIGYLTDLYVTVEPEQVAVFLGETAIYTATPSMSSTSYQWYKGPPEDPNIPLSDEAGHISGSDSNQLTIIAQAGDEGYYCCKVGMSGGTVPSQTVSLTVKRMVANWTLDTADYNSVDDLYADASGEGHDADVSGTPVFVDGVDPTLSSEGMQIDPVGLNGTATAGTWQPAEMTGQFTLSAWIKWDGSSPNVEAGGSDILTKADDWGTARWMVKLLYVGGDPNLPRIRYYNYPIDIDNLSSTNVPVDEWTHVCATFDASNSLAILYIDGLEDKRDPSASTGAGPDATIRLGHGYFGEGSGFPGVLDDLRIYNYALNEIEVAMVYGEFKPNAAICLESQIPELDISGPDGQPDCRVDFYDFAEFAESWLECTLIPPSSCY